MLCTPGGKSTVLSETPKIITGVSYPVGGVISYVRVISCVSYGRQRCQLSSRLFFGFRGQYTHPRNVYTINYWEDNKKRHAATTPRHRAVRQNTTIFLTPIPDADWSTQPGTGF